MQLERTKSLDELERGLVARLNIVHSIRAGQMTRDEGAAKLLALGGTKSRVAFFLLHTLDQAALDEERKRTGVITD